MANEIKKIGVVGAGTMGAAITQHFVMKGLDVCMVDIKHESLDRGSRGIDKSLSEAVKRRIVSEDDKTEIISRLKLSTKFADLQDCDLVVEAVFEDSSVKSEVFNKLEVVVRPDCILASNSSSYSVSDLAASLKNSERFVGVHYFFHAAKNKLVEIIPGEKTSPELVERLKSFYQYYEKLPILVKDIPGFAVNRFFVPWLNEAVRLMQEGHGSPAFIDEVARKAFKIGMGPFALMNATGVPIAMHAADGLAEKFGPFYASADGLKAQVESKTDWDVSLKPNEKGNELEVKERLWASALGIAAQMVSEGAATPTDTDLGARLGLRWFQGPFEMINNIGLEKVTVLVEKLFAKWDMPVPKLLEEAMDLGEIPIEHVRAYKAGSCGFVEFNRPDSMNALNETVMEQLEKCFEQLDSDQEVEKIFFLGMGKAFVAGADIKFFIDNIAKDDLDRIYDFTSFGQKVLAKIENCSKPTVAYLDGLTLGGGLELALACKYRLGTSRTLVAFPETGIGIYPGLGGTQRAPRLIGKGIAKFLIATGKMASSKSALDYGLVDQVIDRVKSLNDFIQIDFGQISKKSNQDKPENVFSGFDGLVTPELFSHEVYKKYQKQLSSKAPLALKKAMELVDAGLPLSLDEGLQLEMDSLKWIFATKDANTGLSSVIKRERPVFLGE